MSQRRRTPATEYFGAELRRTREEAGMSREELGKLTGYVSGTIAQLEIGERFPQEKFIAWLGEHFQTGRFELIYHKLLRRDAYPESFRPWIDIEQEATALRWFELSLVPGLLQTEDYARAIFRGRENIDAKVAARLERQAVLRRDGSPEFVAVIDESTLRRPVGGDKVMREQLLALAEAAERWIIQVVPWGARSYLCLDGPFVLATLDGSDVVYLPTAQAGYILDSHEAVTEIKWRWDAIRGEALSRWQSKDLILHLAGSDE
jgi:transcriptional regulator with XRE-family HTH domain